MLTAGQVQSNLNFAERMDRFINRDDVRLRMSSYQDNGSINNSFYIYGLDENKHFLGKISFDKTSAEYDYFIDYHVISFLTEKRWI